MHGKRGFDRWQKQALSALVFALATAAASAQAPPDWSVALEENRPWAALQALRQSPEQGQIAAQVSVFIGDEAPACRLFGNVRFEEGVEYRDALAVIAEHLGEHRVVMLNESHFRRVHRAFLWRLLDVLHARGFDALAAETFDAHAPDRLKQGIVDTGIGFYSADPMFAAALRKAHALGWEFVDYEVTGDKQARESGQATRLAAWIEANPGRKLLVHAGGAHISKVAEEGWMASRFAALSGIEPLTIAQGQTACPANADAWPVDADHALAVLREGRPLKGRGDADIVVIHPTAAVAAAEDMMGEPVSVCVDAIPDDSLLRAFSRDDGDRAIARAQAVVLAGQGAAMLRLLPGSYRIEREHTDARQTLGHVNVAAPPAARCLDMALARGTPDKAEQPAETPRQP